MNPESLGDEYLHIFIQEQKPTTWPLEGGGYLPRELFN